MYKTARNLVVNLTLIAQVVILWQGAFAAGFFPFQAAQHQTLISDHTQPHANSVNPDCQHDCCRDCDDCSDCGCSSIGLVPSNFTISLCQWGLNYTAFPSFLDWLPVLLIKPPRRKFCS